MSSVNASVIINKRWFLNCCRSTYWVNENKSTESVRQGKYTPVMTYINDNKTRKIQTMNNTNSDQWKYNTRFRTVHYLGVKMCKWPDISVGRAAVLYSEGFGFMSRKAAHFSHTVTHKYI
jgi:hypothetical protein